MPITIASDKITFTDTSTLSTGFISTEQIIDNAVTNEKLATDAIANIEYSQLPQAMKSNISRGYASMDRITGAFDAYGSFNILAIADTSTKIKTVTFINPLQTNRYIVLCSTMCQSGETSYQAQPLWQIEENQTISQFIINNYDETARNFTRINFVVFEEE